MAAAWRGQGVPMRFALWVVTVALVCHFGASGSLQAHSVPKDNHDRTLVVRLSANAVRIDYRLELDEARATRDLPDEELRGISTRTQFYKTFSRYFADVLADNLVATLDGQPLQFHCVERAYKVLDHLRC